MITPLTYWWTIRWVWFLLLLFCIVNESVSKHLQSLPGLQQNNQLLIAERQIVLKRLEQVRDIFLFSRYTAYCDVANLTKVNIVIGTDVPDGFSRTGQRPTHYQRFPASDFKLHRQQVCRPSGWMPITGASAKCIFVHKNIRYNPRNRVPVTFQNLKWSESKSDERGANMAWSFLEIQKAIQYLFPILKFCATSCICGMKCSWSGIFYLHLAIWCHS